jgi:alginate O-acetyltransferase complex protein AlgJ
MTTELQTKQQTVEGQQARVASLASSSAASSNPRRNADAWLVALSIVLCAVFAIGTIVVNPNSVSLDEKRKLATLPKFRLKRLAEFRDGLDSFLNDRLFGRQQIIRLRSCARYLLFNVSSTPNFTPGKEGWLYLISSWCGRDVRHELHMTPGQLLAWDRVLKYRTQWFAKRGIHYVFIVAPNKDSIYPEYLPKAYEPIGPISRLDELTKYLSVRDGFTFINPIPDIVRGKKQETEILYRKLDTHWNAIGARYAYNALLVPLRQWYPSLSPLKASDFLRTPFVEDSPDILVAMGLHGLLKETLPTITLKPSEKPRLPIRVTVFHDSFGPALKPYFEHDFAHVTYHHKTSMDLDLEEIAREKPDLVVEEVVERHVSHVQPTIYEWRKWIVDNISKNPKKNPATANTNWLDILPNTPNISVQKFSDYSQPSGCNIQAVTSRLYTTEGEKVTFDPQQLQYHDWFLLKDGEQGAPLLDKQSQTAYADITKYITGSGKFERVSGCPQADGSNLTLYRKID